MKLLKTLFLPLCLLFMSTSAWCQTAKGMWSAGGLLHVDRNEGTANGLNYSFIATPKCSYVFHDKWRVFGKYGWHKSESFKENGFGLSLYYAYYKRKKLEGYFGLDYERTKSRIDLVRDRFLRLKETKVAPVLGYLIFLRPNVAFDFSGRYVVYHKRGEDKSWDQDGYNTEKELGLIGLDLSLRFFFGKTVLKDTSHVNSKPGLDKWMIGGTIRLGGEEEVLFEETAFSNQLMLYGGRRIGEKWQMGSRLGLQNYRNLRFVLLEANPFIRYYPVVKPKHLLYLEFDVKALYLFNYRERRGKRVERLTEAFGSGIGWNKRLAPRTYLDLFAGVHFSKNIEAPGFLKTPLESDFYMQFGLAYFLK